MSLRSSLSCLALATCAIAQSPLTTTFANNNGGAVGGAVYFDLECLDPAGVTIHAFGLNFGGGGGSSGTVDVYLKPSTWAPHTAPWTGPVATGVVAASSPVGTPTDVVLASPIELVPGTVTGVALVCSGGLQHAYTTATGLPPTVANGELELTVGGAANSPFVGAAFAPRLVNADIHYLSGLGGLQPTTATPFGAGCVASYTSFYEPLAPTAFDLAGTALVATPNASGGFDVVRQPASLDPVGVLDPGATPLALGDDTSIAVGSHGLEVFANGQVAFGPGNDTFWTPSVATMLGNPATAIYCWSDFSPNLAGSGQVYYEEAGATVQVTYDGVYMFGTTDPTTVQFRIDTVGGGFELRFGAMATSGPEDFLVGYSVGGASLDPGATDLSSITVLSTQGSDAAPLSLSPSWLSTQLAAGDSLDVVTDRMPATMVSHLGVLGFGAPSLPLAGIGMPGCWLHASLDATQLSFPVGQASHTWSALTLPAGPVSLSGFELYLQSVVFGSGENGFLGLGALTSNGLKVTLGTIAQPLAVTAATPLSGPHDTVVTIDGSGFALLPEDNDVGLAGNQAEILSATPTQLVVRFVGSATTASGPIEVARGARETFPAETVTVHNFTSVATDRVAFVSEDEVELPQVQFTPSLPTLPPGFRMADDPGDELTVDFTNVNWTSGTRFSLRFRLGGNRYWLRSDVDITPSSTATPAQCLGHVAQQIQELAADKGLSVVATVEPGPMLKIRITGGSRMSVRIWP